MNNRKILNKIRKYTGYLEPFFLIVGAILGIISEIAIPAAICFACFAILVLGNSVFDSYFYYTDLDLEKGQKKVLLISLILEILFCTLMVTSFLIGLFANPHFISRIILSLLIIISAFGSMFFAELEDDKHNKEFKICVCILYSINIIVICAAKL